MGNTISKLFTVFLAVLLMFLYPLMNMFEEQERTTRIFILSETTLFVDSILNIGELSQVMYGEFLNKLDATNNSYDIVFEHRHRTYDPIYDDPLDETTFNEDFNVNYEAYYTDEILTQIYESVDNTDTYYFSQGDYLIVTISNRNETIGTKVKQLIYGKDFPDKSIVMRYGGMIK